MIRQLLFLFSLIVASQAGMFSSKNGIIELTPKNIKKFMASHKPAIVLFYAPWCGHCKAIHPEYEKLGKSIGGAVRVAAVDCDQHKDIGGKYGIQGFPTLKLFGQADAGKNKVKGPTDYQGERKFGAMKNAALNLVHAKNVKKIKGSLPEEDNYVVLFTKKAKSPPIYSVLSGSPKLVKNFNFYMVKDNDKIKDEFKVESWPSILVRTKSGDKWMAIEKGSAYKDIAAFINDAAPAAETEEE